MAARDRGVCLPGRGWFESLCGSGMLAPGERSAARKVGLGAGCRPGRCREMVATHLALRPVDSPARKSGGECDDR